MGKRKTPFSSATYVSLAALPEATSQEGWLTIRSLDGTTLAIKATSSKPIPCDPEEPERRPTSRARYRFDPSRNAQIMVDHVRPGTAPAPLWAWNCHLTSQLLATGETIHHCRFSVGECRWLGISVSLADRLLADRPGNKRCGRFWARTRASRDGSYTIPLPVDVRFPHVHVAYKSPERITVSSAKSTRRFPKSIFPCWLDVGRSGCHPSIVRWRAAAMSGPRPPDRQLWREGCWARSPRMRASVRFACFHPRTGCHWLIPAVAVAPSSACGQLVLAAAWRAVLGSHRTAHGDSSDLARALDRSATAVRQVGIWAWRSGSMRGNWPTKDSPWISSSRMRQAGCQQMLPAISWQSNELVLATHGNILLLTSLDGLAHSPTSIQPTNDPAVVSVCDGSSLGVELQSLGKWTSAGILPLQAWVADPVIAGAPWKTRRDVTRRGVAGTYWQTCEVEVDPEGSCVLSIQQPQSLWAIGWAVLLATAGSVSWLGTRWPGKLIPMLMVAAILAMLVPAHVDSSDGQPLSRDFAGLLDHPGPPSGAGPIDHGRHRSGGN